MVRHDVIVQLIVDTGMYQHLSSALFDFLSNGLDVICGWFGLFKEFVEHGMAAAGGAGKQKCVLINPTF